MGERGSYERGAYSRRGGGLWTEKVKGGGNRALLHGDRMLINWGFNS